jgi:cytidylate kinase
MGRLLTGLGGALGLAWLWRFLRREQEAQRVEQPDPAAELRAKLEQAREAADDRDEFDAAEGQPLDEAERPLSLDERRRSIHEKAQQALGEMNRPGGDE